MNWYEEVRAGDSVTVDPLWNKTERVRKLQDPTTVEAIKHGQASQSGTMFLVRFKNGDSDWLDAEWFARSPMLVF